MVSDRCVAIFDPVKAKVVITQRPQPGARNLRRMGGIISENQNLHLSTSFVKAR